MDENLRGIPCGHNPVVLGSVVDGNTKIFGEIVTVFSGDIIFGSLTKLDVQTECDNVRLSDLYDKYKDDILSNDILYVVVTNGLSGTIYDCGHTKTWDMAYICKNRRLCLTRKKTTAGTVAYKKLQLNYNTKETENGHPK